MLKSLLGRAADVHRHPAALFACIAAGAGILATLRAAMGHLIMPSFVPWNASVVVEPLHWGLWMALSAAFGRLIQRFPPDRARLQRALLAHLLTAMLLALVVSTIVGYARFELIKAIDLSSIRASQLRWNPAVAIPGGLVDALAEYAAIAGLCYAFFLYAHSAERRRESAELQQNLVAARLRALQSQLHPHFLFNVLHSTAMLAPRDGLAARDTLVALSDLLRRTLNSQGRTLVPLSEEVDFLDRYLALEQHRFADRLQVAFNVDDEALGAIVPHLILQPLVENAVRHGVSKIATVGIIEISAQVECSRLRITVHDNGPGLCADWNEATLNGIGIANVRQRLAHLYGNDYRFAIGSSKDGGAVASLDLPYVTTLVTTLAA